MKSLEELNKIKNKYIDSIGIRTDDKEIRVIVGMGNSGIVAGARDVLIALTEKITAEGLGDKILVMQEARVSKVGLNPVIEIEQPEKETVTYVNMTVDKACRVVEEHLKGGKIVEEYVYSDKEV